MLDIKYIRENAEEVKEATVAKHIFKTDKEAYAAVDAVLDLDKKRRELLSEIENLRSGRNKAAKTKDVEKGKKVKATLKKLSPKLRKAEEDYKKAAYQIPNLPAKGVPGGKDESKNKVLEDRTWGKKPKFDFKPKDHLDLGEALDIIDVKRAAKVSGTRFGYLKGDSVLLEFALVNFAFSKLIKKGFTPLLPPMIIKREITEQLGYWHGGGNENYYFLKDYEQIQERKERELDLYLVGTGEHSTVPIHSGEVLEEKELPKKYVTFSSCFRRESGSYGKDTRGILRVHQFDKVEMVEFVKPEDDIKEHESMLSNVEELMQELELPYRVVVLAAGDTGFPTAKTYDIETWLPGQNKYRETHSVSTTTDYQARRLDIKYRDRGVPGVIGGGIIPVPPSNKYVHILNGTAFAIGRTIIAILENYQQKDGSVDVPKALQKWVGKEKITSKNG